MSIIYSTVISNVHRYLVCSHQCYFIFISYTYLYDVQFNNSCYWTLQIHTCITPLLQTTSHNSSLGLSKPNHKEELRLVVPTKVSQVCVQDIVNVGHKPLLSNNLIVSNWFSNYCYCYCCRFRCGRETIPQLATKFSKN